MERINILLALRRPALDMLHNEPVDQGEFYSLFAVNSQIDCELSKLFNQYYWLHVGDFDTFAEAVVMGKSYYTFRIVRVKPFDKGYMGYIL